MATSIQWQNSSGAYISNSNPLVAGTNYKLYSYVDSAGYYTISIRVKNSYGTTLNTYVIQNNVNKSAGSFWTIDITPLLQYAEYTSGGKIDAILTLSGGSSYVTGDYSYQVPIPTTPTFTAYPSATISNETQISLSWSASTVSYGTIAGYILERKIDSGSWTQIYSGTSRSYTDPSDKSTWTTVAYRVKSYTSATSSSYTTGSNITITHAGMIIKNNGIWSKGVPYVKNNGVWSKGIGVYIKNNGVWTQGK